jgi:DNA repair protein RecN (Recombination protein N)
VDLLRHQLAEIEAAGLDDPDEDAALGVEEERLADAARYREAAGSALAALDGADDGGGATDRLGQAAALLSGRPALAPLAGRLESLQAEASDVASELRAVLHGWDDDPERLAEVRARRQLLRDLARKYGEGVAGVIAYAGQCRSELAELDSAEETAARKGAELVELDARIGAARAVVGLARRRAAGRLAEAVEERLQGLAMPRARVEVRVGEDDPGDDVTFLLGANPGEPLLPLGKVASGGELARAMLALRLVLSEAPPTMVFDEVDAGVGGEAALSVGRALAELARGRQVLVVTHLAQVAAFADHQLVVRKDEVAGRTVASVAAVHGEDRVVELARMLSGRPDSATAHRHAEELLAAAGEGTLHR